MASKKQKGMVFHQEGAMAHAAVAAPDRPPTCFVPKPANVGKGGKEQKSQAANDEADMMEKSKTSKVATRTRDGLPAVKHPTSSNFHSGSLPPDSICKGVRVTLDNNSMWNEFFRCKTEMILTKQGSRMFPYCRFRISGLNPSRKYTLVMDIQPLDNSHYRWTGKSWQVAGTAQCHVKSQPFAHPESPSMGQHWMQNPVSFYKLKLTNNILDQEGNTILHPMHRYLPRLHVVQTDKAAKDINLHGPSVVTFTFPQTEFMAVLAYQNSRFAQLKVDYNPFAKGLKEDGSSAWGLKPKLKSCKDVRTDGGTISMEQRPVKKSLKSLLANHKPRSSKMTDLKPSFFGEPPQNSATIRDQSTAKVPMESVCISHPAQKLFSELIREAHVSLQRCNVEQLSVSNGSCRRTEPTNTKKSQREDVPKKEWSEAPPAESSQGENKHRLSCSDWEGDIKTGCFVSSVAASTQNFPADSGSKCKPEVPSEVNLKQHKRPAPLPLPALALFLKRHSTRTKKLKSKRDSPPSSPSSESLSGSQATSAVFACLPVDRTSSGSDLLTSTVDVTESKHLPTGCAGADVNPNEMTVNDPGQVGNTDAKTLSLSCVNAAVSTDLHGIRTESPERVETSFVLPTSDPPPGSPQMSTPTNSSSSTFPPALDTVLPVKSPQVEPITEASALPPHQLKMKSESLFSDPDCSSVGFESLSPASSPEPLPPLPASLGLEFDNSASGSSVKVPDGSQQSRNSATSVFKWHTVLPPPEPYLDTSFPTFQPTPQPLPCITQPFLNSQTPSQPEPQPLLTSTPPTALTFPENEQSLPFPAELSPLALQLPLSPTFSSLDGEGLSPTPSLADLVHFFSTDDDLGMGVEFSNTEAVAPSCSPPSAVEATAQEFSQQVQPVPANKTFKRKKSSRRQKLGKTIMDQKSDASMYTKMQPNLEEVEEQLFISFTSKEALRLHVADPEEAITERTPEVHLQPAADTPESDTAEAVEKRTSTLETVLLRDLKLMKHRQVIHPVLQEVGLKMNLLDPSLAIDLQYLGVRLPIPPPGVSSELPPPQAFVSRTGKTTDVTQIKGWREKFTPSEAPSAASSAKPEAGPSSDLTKKNLSAFCSDMLDEYLEHEGKLIDERAASFSQPQVEPVVYELPTRSTSYVRTLDSVLKKHPGNSPTSDLISGFIPPSKRPKLSPKERKTLRRGEQKSKGAKQNKLKLNPEPGPTPEQTLPAVLSLGVVPPSEHAAPVTEPHKSKKKHMMVQLRQSPLEATFKKTRKPKPKASSRAVGPLVPTVVPISEDMAPLESDSEVGATDQASEPSRKRSGAMITQALLRQKDLEDGVVWEGRPRTSITEERATIALMSLFTQMGFLSENPTAPIQPLRRRAPPCLNAFCRLGCICSSLSHCSKTSHCGRPRCMFGCSCLKQKVVLLKNLDSSDSSSSQQQSKRRRRRRMKMAYILKEADSVSQPAERIQTLWKDCGGFDPDPVHVPDRSSRPRFTENRQSSSNSCARVRGFTGRKRTKKQKETTKIGKSKVVRLKSLMNRDLTLKEPKTKPSVHPPAPEAVQAAPCQRTPSPPSEPSPKPSKRLIILAECKWESDSDRNQVLKALCESMAQDRLRDPFWIKKYLISPLTKTVEDNGTDSCIQYKIHISTPKVEPEKPLEPPEPQQGITKPQQTQEQHLRQVSTEVGPLEVWQQQVMEDEELLEDWQREVEEDDTVEDEGYSLPRVDNVKETSKERKMNSMGLPFLTGISPAGFLSANRKKPGGTEHLVLVNGKLYPLAKIQLGKMGALHPANRLAAYLTGRVGSNKDKQASSSVAPHASGPPPQTTTPPPSSTGLQAKQSAALKAPEGAGTRLHMVNVRPAGETSQVKGLPSADGSAPTDSEVNTSVVRPVNPSVGSASSKASRVLMVEVLGSLGKVPVSSIRPTSQKMALKPVRTASGVQFYRRPDGKLVQLVPVSQLRSGNPSRQLQKGPRPQSLLPSASPQTPAVTVVKQTHPVIPKTTTTSAASLSGLRSSSVPLLSCLPRVASGSLPQKGMCTFKIVPAGSNREPIIITCPKVPLQPPTKMLLQPQRTAPVTPVKLVSLKPSPGEGAGIRVKPVSVSAATVGSGRVLASPEPATSKIGTAETPTERPLTPPAPPASDLSSPEPEVACDLVDLDIICVDDETMEVVNGGRSSSSETENSSDFESDIEGDKDMTTTNPAKPVRRLLHNVLERQRRGQIRQLFEGLKNELGLNHEKTSKISILKKAVQAIEELRATHRHLEMNKRRLMDRRRAYLRTIALTKDERDQSSCGSDVDLMEVVDPSDGTDETTDNSSDEDVVVTKTPDIITITNDKDDDVRCVAVEEDYNRLSSARRLMQTLEAPRVKASRPLCSVLDTSSSPLLKEKACEENHTQSETRRLDLNQQRDTDINELCQESGESEQMGLEKLQLLSAQQEEMEKWDRQREPAEVGDSNAPPVENDFRSSDHQQTPQTPPSPVSTTTPVQQPHMLLQLSNSVLAAPNKPRTIPNILSRRKSSGPASSLVTNTVEGEAPSFHPLLPTEVLSLVGTTFPGQPVLALSPLMAGPTVLQTTPGPGVVTLNLPSLTNQTHLASLPRLPAASNLTNLLQLVQPQLHLQPVAPEKPQKPQVQRPALSLVASTGSDQDKDQRPPQSQTVCRPESSSSSHSIQRLSSSPGPGLSKSGQFVEGGAVSPEQQQETKGGAEAESLTSLLNEIDFLNQQPVTVTTTGCASSPVRQSQLNDHPHCSWVPQPDSEIAVTMETQRAGIAGDQSTTTKSGVLAPPPLLQMSMGGAKMSDPSAGKAPAGGGGVGGGSTEGGVAWRPMPRLVPLGLRGNQIS